MYNFKIVVVDDEPIITNTLCKILREAGYPAFAAYEAEGALMLCRHHAPALLISDVNMPGLSGIELAQQVFREMPACEILLFSGHVDTARLLEAERAQGHHFECLAKPMHPADLLERVGTLSDDRERKKLHTA
jgi:CheY-like chemotaxis protein